MTPEQTAAIAKRTRALLKEEAEERWAHTKVLATALGARVR